MRKKSVVTTVVLVIVAIIVVGTPIYWLFGVNWKSSSNISYYRALSGETDGRNAKRIFGPYSDVYCPYALPQLSELGEYEDVRFRYKATRVSFFQSHSYVLIVEYDAQTYEEQKQILDERYTYCTQESQGFAEGDMTEFMCTMDEYEIRAVEGGDYPKEMLFIGKSDSRKELAIIYFYDQDLDYIDDPLGKFIEKETGWKKAVR